MSADGLWLRDRKLYACYAPEVFDAGYVKRKFNKDLANAKKKRSDEFGTFVYVHNDTRGIHPEISRLIAQAQDDEPAIKFEQFGPRHLLRELLQLPKNEIEDILGCPIPIQPRIYGIGLEDLEPLLQHLMEHRHRGGTGEPPLVIPETKLSFNRLSEDDASDLRSSIPYTFLVEQYYGGLNDVTERDEVAADFNAYYREVAREYEDPGEIIWKLQEYVLGNGRSTPQTERCCWVILAHFFETCDIFERPPYGWVPTDDGLVVR
jgi:hypothetical protein